MDHVLLMDVIVGKVCVCVVGNDTVIVVCAESGISHHVPRPRGFRADSGFRV